MDKQRREAFTLMEMMVVVGMLGLLMAVTFSGVGQARERARRAKANAEVRELVNAILAYEAAEGELPVTQEPVDATEESLADLLGNSGGPVYLNIPVKGAFLDPWGKPYRFRIGLERETGEEEKFSATVTFPNRHRNIRW
ncbi:MAG TPA: type II secretion system protein GspG [Kiritimatiellia bacterium]|nr:type II secretion system protein GspG [Kiritimatiellia bacterium]